MLASHRSYFISYTVLYFLAFIPLLLVTGYFQDDWVWFGQPDSYKAWTEIGRPYNDPVIGFLHWTSGKLSSSRWLSFILYYFSGIFAFKIMKKEGFKESTAYWCALLTALMPVNYARVTMCITQYVFSFFVFIVAAYFMQKFFKDGEKLKNRIISLILFILSFVTNSFLVIYAVPALLIIKYRWKKNPIWKTPLLFFDFFIIPPLFYFLNKIIFPAYGIYEGYNAVTLNGLKSVPTVMKNVPKHLYRDLSWMPNYEHILFGIIFILSALILTGLYLKNQKIAPERAGILPLVLATAATGLAILPYAVVVRMPAYYDWDSRHYLTAHLVLAPLILSIIGLIKIARIRIFLLATLCCFFVAKNFVIYTEYMKDGHITMALMEEMKASDIIRNHRSFVYHEMKRPHRTLGRVWRHYEFSNMQRLAFGDSKRIAINSFGPSKKLTLEQVPLQINSMQKNFGMWPSYGHHEYKPDGRIFYVIILPGEQKLTAWGAFQLTFQQLTDIDSYKKQLLSLLELKILEIKKTQ